MTTNQAFIKAYRQDFAEPAPLRPTTASAPRATAAAPGTSIEYVSVATVGAPQFAATYDTSTTSLPREAQRNIETDWPTCDAPFGRIDVPKRVRRPLSAFTDFRRAAERDREADRPSIAFQPATTIASFAWPPVCRILCQQYGKQFDRVAQLLVKQAVESRPVIGMLGLFPGLGATTTLLCVSARLAAANRSAVVVEGNFIAPRLSAWLDAEPTAWWQDVLERGVSVADAVIHATDDNLDLLPLDTLTANPHRLAATPQIADTATALRHAYDLVLVDLGAFFDPDSQPIALELIRNMRIDAVLAVTGPKPADARDLATVAEYLAPSGCELLGTIENRIARSPLTSDL